MASRCPGAAAAVAGTTAPEESLRCPFLASAAAQRYAVLPGGAGAGRPLFAGVASFAEALLAAHGPRGALPLPTCAPAAAEAAGCPFAKALRAQEAAASPVAATAAAAAPTCGAAVAPVCVAPLTAALARLPLATISFPRNGGPLRVRLRAAARLFEPGADACGRRQPGLPSFPQRPRQPAAPEPPPPPPPEPGAGSGSAARLPSPKARRAAPQSRPTAVVGLVAPCRRR
jgi:hypothetical protein